AGGPDIPGAVRLPGLTIPVRRDDDQRRPLARRVFAERNPCDTEWTALEAGASSFTKMPPRPMNVHLITVPYHMGQKDTEVGLGPMRYLKGGLGSLVQTAGHRVTLVPVDVGHT